MLILIKQKINLNKFGIKIINFKIIKIIVQYSGMKLRIENTYQKTL